jgi:hypothetical protein
LNFLRILHSYYIDRYLHEILESFLPLESTNQSRNLDLRSKSLTHPSHDLLKEQKEPFWVYCLQIIKSKPELGWTCLKERNSMKLENHLNFWTNQSQIIPSTLMTDRDKSKRIKLHCFVKLYAKLSHSAWQTLIRFFKDEWKTLFY